MWKNPDWDSINKEYIIPTLIKEKGIIPSLTSDELKNVYEDKYILDAGCGPGHITQALLDKFNMKEYIGIDTSEHAISFAKENNKHPHCKYFIGDSINLNFKSESFDTVLSVNVIPTIDSKEKLKNLLSECHRVLRSNGTLIIVSTYSEELLSNKSSKNFQAEIIDRSIIPIKCKLKVRKTDNSNVEFFDLCWPSEIIKLEIENAGFDIIRTVDISDQAHENYKPFILFQCNKTRLNFSKIE